MRQLLFIIMLSTFIVASNAGANENAQTVMLPLPAQLSGGRLPHFSIRERNGETRFQNRQLERLINDNVNRVALIYFATWCVPCAHGAEQLKNARAELDANGVLPIFINIGERDVAAINAWVDRYAGEKFMRLLDTQSQMTRQFGLLEQNGQMITPKTIVLDRELKPLFLFGEEGRDYPRILWEYNP